MLVSSELDALASVHAELLTELVCCPPLSVCVCIYILLHIRMLGFGRCQCYHYCPLYGGELRCQVGIPLGFPLLSHPHTPPSPSLSLPAVFQQCVLRAGCPAATQTCAAVHGAAGGGPEPAQPQRPLQILATTTSPTNLPTYLLAEHHQRCHVLLKYGHWQEYIDHSSLCRAIIIVPVNIENKFSLCGKYSIACRIRNSAGRAEREA